MIRSKIYRRKITNKNSKNEGISLFNRFQCLVEESCEIKEDKIVYNRKLKNPTANQNDGNKSVQFGGDSVCEFRFIQEEENKKFVQKKEKRINSNKDEESCLQKFETMNRFEMIDADVQIIIKKIEINKTPKKGLKKCRFCNFKKRSCSIDPSACTAKDKTCWRCNKVGHFPQSLCCQILRRLNRRKSDKVESDEIKSISKRNWRLIVKRIKELEYAEKQMNKQLLDKSESEMILKQNFGEGGNDDCETVLCLEIDEMEPIIQVDGNDDIPEEDFNPNSIYSVNCEHRELITWINFLRSIRCIWRKADHLMCAFGLAKNISPCFFCLIRSSCLRLSNRGQKGPKSLKPYEALSQLDQFERNGGDQWKNISKDMPTFIEETLKLLCLSNICTKQIFDPLYLVCNVCNKSDSTFPEEIIKINSEKISSLGPISVEYILNKYINDQNLFSCNHELKIDLKTKEKLIVFSFSNPIVVRIKETILFGGKCWKYQTHIEEKSEQSYVTFFMSDEFMVFQNDDGGLSSSMFGIQSSVKILAFVVSNNEAVESFDSSQFIYKKNIQLKLHKTYLSTIIPEAYDEKQNQIKTYETNRTSDQE